MARAQRLNFGRLRCDLAHALDNVDRLRRTATRLTEALQDPEVRSMGTTLAQARTDCETVKRARALGLATGQMQNTAEAHLARAEALFKGFCADLQAAQSAQARLASKARGAEAQLALAEAAMDRALRTWCKAELATEQDLAGMPSDASPATFRAWALKAWAQAPDRLHRRLRSGAELVPMVSVMPAAADAGSPQGLRPAEAVPALETHEDQEGFSSAMANVAQQLGQLCGVQPATQAEPAHDSTAGSVA